VVIRPFPWAVTRTLSSMMLPPGVGDDTVSAPYDVPRGTCPACGSGKVTHLVIGMPSGPAAMDGSPAWVSWVGCVHPGYNRECNSCGTTWSADFADGMDTP